MSSYPSTSNRESVKDWLLSINISSIKSHDKAIISVSENQTVSELLQVLSENNILSVPVMVGERDSLDYVGFADVLDILTFILKAITKEDDMEKMQWSPYPQDPDEFEARISVISTTPVRGLINLSRMDNWYPVYESGSLYELIEMFAAYGKVTHRVPVWRDEKKIVEYIATQSDIIRYLASQMSSDHPPPSTHPLIEISEKTLEEMGFCFPQNVISMSSRATVIHGCFQMYYHHVYGIAVIDGVGNLVGNLSISDLKRLGSGSAQFRSLLQPIYDFLCQGGTVLGRPNPPITCKKTATLREIVLKLAHHQVHRIWVVDEVGKAIGVVTLTDVMRTIAPLEESEKEKLMAARRLGKKTSK